MRKLGFKLHIRATASLEVEKRKEVDTPTGRRLLTRDWREAVEHPEADIVVEVVGGTTIAYEVQTTALALGRPVVTANKELLGLRGAELAQLARDNKTSLHLEASAGGGIPILNALREGIAADSIEAIYGILNGTSNYILTRMEQEGASFDDVLDAQTISDLRNRQIILAYRFSGGTRDHLELRNTSKLSSNFFGNAFA